MLQHSNATLSGLAALGGRTGELAARELRDRDHALAGLVHPVVLAGGSFRACASCAYDEDVCSCDRRDIQNYRGQVLDYGRPASRPLPLAARQAALKALAPRRPKGLPAMITVRATRLGWLVEATSEGTLPFRMGLRAREAGGSHTEATVAALLKKIADTYPRGTRVPPVPAHLTALSA
jgi:hypothetical protein